MKKYAIWIVLGILVLFGITGYNGLVSSRESVNGSWSNVETQYQRRADLIPNLVTTVKGEADFEKSTLTAVIEARSKATSIHIDPNNMTPEKLQEFQAAQSQVGGALSRLLVVAENYPNLKATQGFQDFMVELAGTENRINFARDQFIAASKEYNVIIQKFPRNILAGLFGFKPRPYFEADKGNEKAPSVKF